MSIQQTIHLTQDVFRCYPVVYMVQGDTGRVLKMVLDDVTLSGSETAEVSVRLPDGTRSTITGATRVSGSSAFTANMTNALVQSGRAECQLKVGANGGTVSTYTFNIMVQKTTAQ